MPPSKIEKRLARQLAAKHEKKPAEMAHALLVTAKIIKPSGELTSKGKVRNAMTPAERARDRAAKASEGRHKAGGYRYVSATNTAALKKGK